MRKQEYRPKVCGHCGQTETYLIALTRGVADIVRAVAVAIGIKGVNIIHPWKEMAVDRKEWTRARMIREGVLTPQQLNNLSHARVHGLIAQVRDEHGNYCLTRKGAEFLRDVCVPRYAIVSKVEGRQIGYWSGDTTELDPGYVEYTVRISQLTDATEYWNDAKVGYEIVEGRIIQPLLEL